MTPVSNYIQGSLFVFAITASAAARITPSPLKWSGFLLIGLANKA